MADSAVLASSTPWAGFAGQAFLIAGFVLVLTRNLSLPPLARVALLILTFGTAFLPIDGLRVAAYLRGLVGDISITTLTLVLLTIASQLSRRSLLRQRELMPLLFFALSAGLLLYPFSTGISGYDAYALGYVPQPLVLVLLVVTILSVFSNSFVLVWCITLSLLAYRAQLYDSQNLWDYLIDPLGFVYAVLLLISARRKGGSDSISHLQRVIPSKM